MLGKPAGLSPNRSAAFITDFGRRCLREPIVHFLVAGLILFSAFAWLRGEAPVDDDGLIVVDRRALLNFLQYRANAFDAEIFGTALDAMSDAERRQVIDAFIDEEVLYREASALGLGASDNVIRQRMIQKMNFLLGDLAAAGDAPSAETLETFFEANREAYAVAPWVTFTHVFFDADRRGADGASEAAVAALAELEARGAGFNDAPAFGDRFPYSTNYVERTLEHVASHFGYAFAEALATLEPSDTDWQGPLTSVFGQHLVLLTRSEDGRLPVLAEVESEVERDYREARTAEALAELRSALRERYRIEIGELGAAGAE